MLLTYTLVLYIWFAVLRSAWAGTAKHLAFFAVFFAAFFIDSGEPGNFLSHFLYFLASLVFIGFAWRGISSPKAEPGPVELDATKQ